MRSSPDGQRGMALLLVLWLAVAIAGWCTVVLALARDSGLSQRNYAQLAAQRIAAASAVELTAARLRDPSAVPEDTLKFGIGERTVEIQVASEATMVDLNASTPELIELIIARELKDDPERVDALVQAIVDWRDENDLRQLNGAEEDDYRRAGFAYGPANGPFRHVAELRGVMGMDDELFQALAPHLTVLTGQESPSGGNTLDLLDQLEGEEEETDEAATETVDLFNPFDSDDQGAADTEDLATDEDSEPIDDEADAEASEISSAENIYRLDVTVSDQQGRAYRATARIWTEPFEGDRTYETLVWEPFSLPPNDEDDE